MRIFLLLTAAAAVAAIATAAPARPAGKPGGHGAGAPGAWGANGRHRARAGWEARSRPPMSRGHDRRDGSDRGRFGRPGGDGVYVRDGFGIAWPSGTLAPWGDGFFAGGGGEVRLKGSRPHYDYDRSYPYEWAPSARRRADRDERSSAAEAPPSCTLEHGVRVCRGW
ncbi:MAG TPA: hypothetical protein VF605_14125 [Allosphingosinicella sp.]|jgi:hypothetical protein